MADSNYKNSFGARAEIDTGSGKAFYFRLEKLAEDGVADISRLPYSIKVLLEAVLRTENGLSITKDDVMKLAGYDPKNPAKSEIPFKPARVLLQDFTGVPAVVDLAALRSSMARLGGDPQQINPRIPVDLVIDHSVQVDVYNSPSAIEDNAKIEFERNRERYEFLRWGQQAFQNFRVVPPASGICHQVNLEYLANVVQRRQIGNGEYIFPDSLVGTDSHTTMINGLGVLGWGVGGIEAEAVMLDQPTYMLMPEVIGFKLTGELPEGTTATDLVLTITQMLRQKGVVGKFVEFYGPGLSSMTVSDRATLANMGPEYGATMGFFPVDNNTLLYLKQTGRSPEQVELVERYCKAQGMFRGDDSPEPEFKETLEFDLSTTQSSLAGPKRPQDRIELKQMQKQWHGSLTAPPQEFGFNLKEEDLNAKSEFEFNGQKGELKHGSVVIAAITSCTNTSNPSVLIGAGVLAKKAVEAGLSVEPYVKTSLAPGSKVVTEYLEKSGLIPHLEKLGFYNVGYGCTTCIGNSGPLPEPIVEATNKSNLVITSVLSGNRNFEGRVSPHTKGNYLTSPPLVVAYAIAGTVDIDLLNDPIGKGAGGNEIYLKDIWPTQAEVAEHLDKALNPDTFHTAYDGIEQSNQIWNDIPVSGGAVYQWKDDSTYIQEPPFFVEMGAEPKPIGPIAHAKALIMVGASTTTDHISPAGVIAHDSPAGKFLIEKGVEPKNFNSYGSRRGNDRVMTRGTFANIRLKNLLAPGTEGGWTTHIPSGEVMSVYEASLKYKTAGITNIALGGIDYGMGSSRDWAAKGTYLLGIKAVIAESFERIHRSNLVGMGVLPLQFEDGQNVTNLGLTGRETFTINIDDNLRPLQKVQVDAVREDGTKMNFEVVCRIDTPIEVVYYRNGGILHTVLRNFLKETS
ncbi:MAG: aconitate hydratase AcnA [candidate division Zixibacteria bacterium]|nr:aconitate hydratase AcnA [candidate division Zixibacteria bacterium]